MSEPYSYSFFKSEEKTMSKKLGLFATILFLFCSLSVSVHSETYVSQPSADQIPVQALRNTSLDQPQEKTLIDHEASIYAVQGDVQILHKDTPTWERAQKGHKILEGDQIKTAPASYADISYNEFYLDNVRIEENTFAEFKSIEPTHLVLLDGKLFNILDGLAGSPYEVSTPSTVAAVRGTRFQAAFDSDAQTNKTQVTHGTVRVFPYVDQEKTLDPRQFYSVEDEKSLEINPQVLETGQWDSVQPVKISEMEYDNLETVIEDSRMNLIKYLGSSDQLLEAAGQWQKLRNHPDKMRLLKQSLDEHSAGLHPEIYAEDIDSEEVLVNGQVVQGSDDEKQQQAMMGAIETFTGKTSDESLESEDNGH